MAETIGAAYVRILADGSGFPESVKREVEKNEKVFKAAGQRHTEAYKEGVKKEMKKGKIRKLNEELTKGILRGEAFENIFDSPDWARFERRLTKQFGDAGTLASQEMKKSIRQAGTFDVLKPQLEHIAGVIRAAQEKIDAARLAEETAFNNKMAAAEKQRLRDEAAAIRARDRDFARFKSEIRSLARDVDRYNKTITASRHDHEDLRFRINELGAAMRGTGNFTKKMEEDVSRLDHTLKSQFRSTLGQLGRASDDLGEKVGQAFGAKNRNNFVNFFGRFVGGASSMLGIIPKAIGGAIDGFKQLQGGLASVSKAFTDAGGGIQGFVAAGAKLAPLAASIVGIVIAVGLVATVISTLAALVSGLVAAMTALAASVSFGLIGGLVLLGGALVPIAAAAVVTVAAFSQMRKVMQSNTKDVTAIDTKIRRYKAVLAATTKGTKEHTQAEKDLAQAEKIRTATLKQLANQQALTFRRIKTDLIGLRQTAATSVFANLPAQAKAFETILRSLRPVVQVIGTAVSKVGDQLLEAFRPGRFQGIATPFQNFLDTLRRDAPSQLASLGSIINSVIKSVFGVWTALSPFVKQFLRDVASAAKNFSTWLNSSKGQKKMTDFFNQAVTSAGELWGLVKSIGNVLGALFTQGAPHGDSIIQSLTDTLNHFADFLRANPGGLNEWFMLGEDTARNVGDLVVNMGKLVGIIAGPEARKNLQDFFDLLQSGMTLIANLMPFINALTFPFRLQMAIGLDLLRAIHLAPKGKDSATATVLGLQTASQNTATAVANLTTQVAGLNGNLTGSGGQIGLATGLLNTSTAADTLTTSAGGVTTALGGPTGLTATTKTTSDAIDILRQQLLFTTGTAPGTATAVKDTADRVDEMHGKLVGANPQLQALAAHTKALGDNGHTALAQLKGLPDTIDDYGTASDDASSPVLILGTNTYHLANGLALLNEELPDTPAMIEDLKASLRGFPKLPPLGHSSTGPGSAPAGASGLIATGPMRPLIGEAGMEAVVPLNRPLAQVDPAVRWLSAVAQGLNMPNTAPAGKSINIAEITVITPAQDPVAVAQQTVNRLVAQSIF